MKFIFTFMFGLVLSLASFNAHAEEPKLLSVHGDWSAYTFNDEGGHKVCFMSSQPTKAKGNYTRRGDIFAFITHRPAKDTRNVFNYVAGYEYKPASDVSLKAAGKSFTLFTNEDKAWAVDDKTDNQITQAIKAGSTMVVTGTSSRGTLTTDTFSLKGSSAAHAAISRACGVAP